MGGIKVTLAVFCLCLAKVCRAQEQEASTVKLEPQLAEQPIAIDLSSYRDFHVRIDPGQTIPKQCFHAELNEKNGLEIDFEVYFIFYIFLLYIPSDLLEMRLIST